MFDTRKIANTYDQIGLYFSATRPKLSASAVSLLPTLPPKAQVLDLGCGNGVLLTALPKNTDYTGLDISQTLIDEARRLHPKHKFIFANVLDPQTWPGLGKYDFIAALAVFHHLPTPDDHTKLLRNIKQHLKPFDSAQGVPPASVLVSVWRLDQPKFDKYRTNEKHLSIPFHPARSAYGTAVAGGGGPSRNFYTFTDEELTELAKQAGFSGIETITDKNNFYYQLA